MHHRFAALFADLARGLGKLLHFPGKLAMGQGYDDAVFRLPFHNIIKGLLHIAGEIILNERKMPAEAGDNLFPGAQAQGSVFPW